MILQTKNTSFDHHFHMRCTVTLTVCFKDCSSDMKHVKFLHEPLLFLGTLYTTPPPQTIAPKITDRVEPVPLWLRLNKY